MRATTAVASLLAVCLPAVSAATIHSRQEGIIYGCHFTGDGISADISVGHDAGADAPLTGTSGKTYELDCGTTSTQPVPGVFAKCTVNKEKPVITAYNATFITCAIP
ncbi:hypothetical protein KVR01_012693 [Diaporthe batatas]|uniref:uncharacterized protein n=1 Tax=Diaporthe batatas TaxID=748121 RepID=UPI001D058316|nr:uncharacterized protein KVR01_012693 [Diaporthe batatas]KAG8157309.1 hypothetical protein KVR01_012693 [Diaporthe batatas]